MKLRVLILAAICCLGACALTSSASAAPQTSLDIHHFPTNFVPGATERLGFDFRNFGDANTSGTITLSVGLPPGLTAVAGNGVNDGIDTPLNWSCPGLTGASSVTCTTADSVTYGFSDYAYRAGPVLNVAVAPGVCGAESECDLPVEATLSGGGFKEAPAFEGCEPGIAACATESVHVSTTPAPFGIVPGSFVGDFFEADGITPVRQSGAHPPQLAFPFDLNTVSRPFRKDPNGKLPVENLRDLRADLPPGFLGNPTAVGECSAAQLISAECPLDSQVGFFDVDTIPISSSKPYNHIVVYVYNMVHPLGSVSDLGFSFGGNNGHIKAFLDPARNYGISTTVSSLNETLPIFAQKLTLWGIPGDASHDVLRDDCFEESNCLHPNLPRKPYLTVPFDCRPVNHSVLSRYDSWEDSGDFGPPLAYAFPGKQTGCEKPRFEPDVEARTIGSEANSPVGLDVTVKVPQNENANGLQTPPVKSTVVKLPEGMTFSPSFADGLDGCTEAQFGISDDAVPNGDPVACPDNSRIGEVSLNSPLLPTAVEGSMYLAKPSENPYGTTFAMYMALHDNEGRGVLIKIPAKIELDPTTGQITTTFDELPQLPFEDFTLKFRSGARAPLINPPSCGTHTISIKIASWAQPDDPVDASNTYDVNEGPGGSACPKDAAHRPFSPTFFGGTLNPVGGSYSPFLFRLERDDTEQELSQVTTILPPGLLAKIAGIPWCPDSAIASISEDLGAGAREQASPSCPPASQVGTVSVGVGAGPQINYFAGKTYLAGPYKGAPLSLVIVVPALAGPYDLGNSAVRVALHVDPDTSRVTAVSDAFPSILHGLILRIRDVRMRLDRAETMLNPTNCEPTSLDAQIMGISTLFDASDRFQVGDCGRLGFKPKIFFKLKGGTHRGDHPAFFSRVLARPGDANIGSAVVALPHSEFLENAHIQTICTRVQYAADQCPAGSIYGYAKAITPLLDDPVQGEVVLRSNPSRELPDLVARLRGKIQANLIGHIDSIHGGIRTSFDTVPDVPIQEFTLTMQGGKKGLLVNSANLCKAPHRADVRFGAQNGKRIHLRPLMQSSCRKLRTKHRRGRAHRRRG